MRIALTDPSGFSSRGARIATAVVLPGANIANHTRFFKQMKTELSGLPNVHLVSIATKDCVNFKTALNHIVKNLTEKSTDLLADEDFKYDRRLRYDLEIVADWCRRRVRSDPEITSLNDLRIVISVDDADSFDVTILSDLFRMLSSYGSHIPVKLVLSVATSIQVYEEKLPRSVIRLLDGRAIVVENAVDGLVTIVKSTLLQRYQVQDLMLGPRLFSSIMSRQKESMESIDSYLSALKYTYMTHYYSNPFSCLHTLVVSDDEKQTRENVSDYLTPSHINALRLLSSFRDHVESLKPSLDAVLLESLLTDDDLMIDLVISAINKFEDYKSHLLYSLNLIFIIINAILSHGSQESAKKFEDVQLLDLYPLVLNGELCDTELFAELETELASSGPDVLGLVLLELQNFAFPSRFVDLATSISENYTQKLAEMVKSADLDDIVSSTSSKDTPSSEARQALKSYAILAREISGLVFEAIRDSIKPYRSMLFHEAFVADTAKLHENVVSPTQRGALEMALSNPKHYWGETSADHYIAKTSGTEAEGNPDFTVNESALEHTDMSYMGHDPHICILYTLYRESSVFVNLYDWYTSFKSIVRKPIELTPEQQPKSEQEWEKMTLAWFIQGVAELKMIGIVRDSKRKFECVEKAVWRGL